MNTALIVLLASLFGALIGAALAVRWFSRPPNDGALQERLDRLERQQREDAAHARREAGELARSQRSELTQLLQAFGQQLSEAQRQSLEEARAGRAEQRTALAGFGESQQQGLSRFGEAQALQAQALRSTLDENLKTLRQDNAEKLEQMRRTVDEKLHETLEKRLGDSFKLVSERLEQVHKGLGEMQTLATGVGDLKRVLTNVKSRGIFGEVQLGALLEQVLTIEQYAANVATRPGSGERVEYAIRLPGRGDDEQPVWLPIDAKFPREDYERLIEAQDRADPAAAETAASALERRIRDEARAIAAKYVAPPHTTDFALLFLPTEGLYAEVLRRPGLFEALQREHRVTVAGPTNLLAFLNSLQMGFRTLTIEKRSSEVWQVLGAVKTEFGKFGDVLDKVRKKLDEATNQLDATGVRTRAITRRLKNVQELPGTEAAQLLGSAADGDDDS
ncbi:MAG TPA: DNA recombination protein RmuC [Solimonas sp.]